MAQRRANRDCQRVAKRTIFVLAGEQSPEAAMADALENVLRRDRAIIVAALIVLTALAWTHMLWLADDMAMVGMMTPSAAPMILIYARLGRQAAALGKPFAAIGWFAAAYLLTWAGFALVATAAQWGLQRLALLDPMMASASQVFGGIVLVAAGVYQWTPLKDKCLAQCQSPFLFIQRHGGFHRDRSGSLALGARHGAYCVGCCWALMALLFVGGVMNVVWIAAIAVFVLAEKIIPSGRLISRIAGGGFIVSGVWLLAHR
jgi:predicted metal-binding membrane protein